MHALSFIYVVEQKLLDLAILDQLAFFLGHVGSSLVENSAAVTIA